MAAKAMVITADQLKSAICALKASGVPVTKAGTWVDSVLTFRNGEVFTYTGPLDEDSYIVPVGGTVSPSPLSAGPTDHPAP